MHQHFAEESLHVYLIINGPLAVGIYSLYLSLYNWNSFLFFWTKLLTETT
jgi:hypothetical protein